MTFEWAEGMKPLITWQPGDAYPRGPAAVIPTKTFGEVLADQEVLKAADRLAGPPSAYDAGRVRSLHRSG